MFRGLGRAGEGRRFWIGTLFLTLAAALVLAACGGSGGTTTTSSTATGGESAEASEGPVAAAPEFTSEELFEHAGDNWVTNGGGTHQRPLLDPRRNQHRKRL